MTDGRPLGEGEEGGANCGPNLLSVVIPVRNSEAYIDAQLDLLAGEKTQTPFEVVVADNGCTDRTIEKVGAYALRFCSLRVVDASSRRGAAHARNVGVQHARGELILFCDADDVIEPGWIDALSQSAAHFDFVAGRLEVETLNSPSLRRSRPLPVPARDLAPSFAPSGDMCIWRRVFLAAGGFDEGLLANEDVDLSARLLGSGFRMGWAPEAVVHYRYRATGWGNIVQSYRTALYGFRAEPKKDETRSVRLGRATREALWLVARVPYLAWPGRRGLWFRHLGEASAIFVSALTWRKS